MPSICAWAREGGLQLGVYLQVNPQDILTNDCVKEAEHTWDYECDRASEWGAGAESAFLTPKLTFSSFCTSHLTSLSLIIVPRLASFLKFGFRMFGEVEDTTSFKGRDFCWILSNSWLTLVEKWYSPVSFLSQNCEYLFDFFLLFPFGKKVPNVFSLCLHFPRQKL